MDFLIIVTLVTLSLLLTLTYLFFYKSLPKVSSPNKQRQQNIALFRQQETFLLSERAANRLSQADFDKLSTDNARSLLESSHQQAQTSSKPTGVWGVLLLLLPLAALPLYGYLGAQQDLAIKQGLVDLQSVANKDAFRTSVATLHSQIEERLSDKPDHIDYRLLAARFAMAQADYSLAVSHFTVIAELLPENAESLAVLAQAKFLENNQQITKAIKALLHQSLGLDPHQATALNLLGLDAFQNEQYDAVVAYWQPLLDQLPENSPQRPLVEQGLHKAKQALSMTEAEIPHLLVTVSLSETISDFPDNTTVFIYAKAVKGPKAPLAAKRLRVADLPVTVRLDDNAAMMPALKMTMFEDIQVGAHLSATGSPIVSKNEPRASDTLENWKGNKAINLLITN